MQTILDRDMIGGKDGSNLEQFVTFMIDNELYGVSVLKVQEIIGITQITHIPNSLAYMKGVINLRGMVVPVVDMRIRFSMSERSYDLTTVILVVDVMERSIGMIVDSVSDVLDLPHEKIQQTPHFSANIDTDYIRSIGNNEGQLVIILDVDRVLNHEDLKKIESDINIKK